MHSYDTKSATFHFDGAFQGGDLIIYPKDKNGHYVNTNGLEIRIDADDILKLVAYHYVLSEAIGNLESMDYLELLSILETKARDRS